MIRAILFDGSPCLPRLQEEQDRIASEPTFSIATVPVNKLRPFYMFAQNQYRTLKTFLATMEKINISLCQGSNVLSTSTIPLIQLASQVPPPRCPLLTGSLSRVVALL